MVGACAPSPNFLAGNALSTVECYLEIPRFGGGNDGSATASIVAAPSARVRRRRVTMSRDSSAKCSAYCIDVIIVASLSRAYLLVATTDLT